MRGTPYIVRMVMTGLSKPKVPRLGVDVAGQIQAVGRNVTQFKPGDQVFGTCQGAFGEYVCTPESKLVKKPDNVTFEQAASVPIAACTALHQVEVMQKFIGVLHFDPLACTAVSEKSFRFAITTECSARASSVSPDTVAHCLRD